MTGDRDLNVRAVAVSESGTKSNSELQLAVRRVPAPSLNQVSARSVDSAFLKGGFTLNSVAPTGARSRCSRSCKILNVANKSSMRPSRSLWSDRPEWLQYVLSLTAVAVALVVRWLMTPYVGESTPFLTVFAVLLVLVVSVKPGPFLAAALAGWIGSWLLFVPSMSIDHAPGPVSTLQLALFLLSILAAIGAAWFSENSRLRAKADARRAEQTKEALRVTLASIGDAVITTDVSGRVVFINKVAEAVTG